MRAYLVLLQSAVRIVQRWSDRIDSGRAVGRGCGGISGSDVVPRLQAANGPGKHRISFSIGTDLIIGGYVQGWRIISRQARRQRDGEVSILERDSIIAEFAVRIVEHRRDRIITWKTERVGAGGVTGGNVITVLNADQATGQRRIGSSKRPHFIVSPGG